MNAPSKGSAKRRPRIRPLPVLLLGILVGGAAERVSGQAQVREFTRPFVTIQTGGPSAPVKALVFTPDGGQLLSAGLDKRVRAYGVGGPRPTLLRMIHPPNWRGFRGVIYAMALAPAVDANGQRLLALAGSGVLGGEILLYRYPSLNGPPTGDLLAALPQHNPAVAAPTGHAAAVNGLAFTPDGRLLASCGADGRVLLWDVAARRVLAGLSGPGPSARTLVLSRNGRFLAVGSRDGRVRVWEVPTRRLLADAGPWQVEAPNRANPDGFAVLSLAFSPDGRTLVLGRENGRLVRLDAPFLLNPTLLPWMGLGRAQVEAVAISPDGRQLATSIIRSKWLDPTQPPRLESDVEVRRLFNGSGLFPDFGTDPIAYALSERPAGSVVARFPVESLVYALAFSPDGRQLAFAGGDAQALNLVDLTPEARPPVRLHGQGASIKAVAFTADSRSIGFERRRPDRPDLPLERVGFDLANRDVREIAPADLSPRPVLNGWRVEPSGPYTLNIRSPQGRVIPINLDPGQEGRWWDHVFLPGNAQAGHPDDCLAVATDGGIAVVNLRTGSRTRTLVGHSGAVYSIAPSPDGRWLVSGSADQTVRLWRLSGIDRRPPLGATLNRGADGRWTVAAIKPLGFAEAMGLKAGDLIEIVAISARKADADRVLPTLDQLPPGTRIEFGVRRGQELVPLVTTRRDSPALALFVGDNRDWILWMPEGYYDTLLAGDRKFLGWHRNGSLVIGPGSALRFEPTDHFAAEKFEAEFRRPRVLDTLFATADLGQALALVPAANRDPSALAEASGPPVIQITAPANRPAVGPLAVAAGNLAVHASVLFEDRRPIRSIRVQVEGQTIGAPIAVAPPQPGAPSVIEQDFQVPLGPGRHRVNVVAENVDGRQRIEGFEVAVAGPPPRVPQLHVLTIGAGGPFADPRIPAIPFADADAVGLRAFLAAPGDVPRFEQIDAPPPLAGARANGSAIREAFARLASAELGPTDTVLVALEAHVLAFDSGRFILGSDSTLGSPPPDAPDAGELGKALASLAKRGCRVMLLLDGVHQPAPPEGRGQLNAWIRALTRQDVIVFTASQSGPGHRLVAEGQGAFAYAITHALEARSQSRPLLGPDDPWTLDDFQATVVDRVKELTGRKQFAACSIPETISPQIRLFDPPGSSEVTAGR